MKDFILRFFAKIARSLSVFKINLTWGGGHFAGRERVNLKNQKTEKNEPHQSQSNLHQNFYSEFLRKILHRLNRKRYFFENSRGTILIEFAFCVPILIITMLAINDLFILFRTRDEFKRTAYCAVQLIQNVSKNRVNNKLITKRDFLNVASICTIISSFAQKAVQIGGINIGISILLVEGTGEDKCKAKYFVVAYINSNYVNGTISYTTNNSSNFFISENGVSSLCYIHGQKGQINKELISTSLYPDLHIKAGEIKAILEIGIEDGHKDGGKKIKEALDLRILNLPKSFHLAKSPTSLTKGRIYYFPAYVIFKPINGIFDKNMPPK